ncbi:hypothetical protein HID58_012832 [Brassica napus]|uniref:Transmembrane protein n=1 Tax=Brassica napus TaxID=3708 RepID=A0ABQ8E270_BRANA|nr:hypothetical protein HID58_012832 [Brassica napus]
MNVKGRDSPMREVREWILSFLFSPPYAFFSPQPYLTSAPVADGGLYPSVATPIVTVFSTSSLLHLLWFSSDSGRIRRTKPASEGVLSFPGVMARSWRVRSEQEASSWNGSGSDLSRRVAGMDKRRCLRRSGQFTASSVFLCLLLRLLKAMVRLFAGDFFLVHFLDNYHGVLLGSRSIGGCRDSSEFRAVTLRYLSSLSWVSSPLSPADGSSCSFALQVSEGRRPLYPASLDVLKLRDGTGVELLKPPLVSACYPPVLLIVGLQRLEWTLPLVMAGPGQGQPCFAYSMVRVAFGTVRGPSDCSPAVFSSGLCGFDVGSGIISLAVSTANFKVVHGTVSLAKL